MPDQFEQYYKYLKANGADVAPDFNSFKNTLSNYDNASKYYTYLKDNKFDVPETYDSFADTFGLKKKVGGEISSLTELPSEFIEPLKQGVSPNQTKEEERAARQLGIKPYTGVTTPTNLPKQDALRYEKEVKVKDAAINTLTDVYKQKGLKFDPSRPAAQQQIQDYIEKEQNNDLGLVEGIKDKKPYLTRTTGLGETLYSTAIESFKEPVKSFKINTISNPNELADVLDEEIKNDPNIPESVPSNVAGYFGQLAGGLPKLGAEEAVGGPALVAAEMYWNGIANQRKTLYQKGLAQGMDRVKAAQMAMDNATISAIPDFVVGAILASGVKGQTGILRQGTADAFKDAMKNVVKSSPKMFAVGAGAEFGKAELEKQAGYKVGRTEEVENMFKGGGDLFKMHTAFGIAQLAPYIPKALYSAAKNVLSETPKPVLDALAQKYADDGTVVNDVNKFAQTKTEVQDLVPEAKVASVTGLTEKVKNIQKDIDDLTARREKTTDALKPQIDSWLKEYQNEIDFYNNQIKKVVESKDPTGVTEEVDDITGQKIGTKQYVVDGKEVSQQEFEAMQGKPIGTKEIVKAEVKPKEIKRIVEPSKPISEMNSEELGDFATETKKALKKQDKDFEGKTEKEKEDGGYYDVIDEVEDLRDASERANFIENAEDVNDLANSVKSTLSNIRGKEPNEYQLAILNAAKNKAIELGIDSKDLIKNIGSKIASQYKDVEDAELMVKSALEKLIPQEVKPIEVKVVESIKNKNWFHGSENEFKEFENKNPNITGFWFSDSKENAATYGKKVKEVSLDIENPLIIDAKGKKFTDAIEVEVLATYPNEKPYLTKIGINMDEIVWMVKNGKRKNSFIEILDHSKYDAVVFKNVIDPSLSSRNKTPQTSIAVFDNRQIKTKAVEQPTQEVKPTEVKVESKPIEETKKIIEEVAQKNPEKIANATSKIFKDAGYHRGTLPDKSDYVSIGYHGELPYTGYYFVSNPKDVVQGGSRKGLDDKAFKIVDFSKYNLFKPEDANSYFGTNRGLKKLANDLENGVDAKEAISELLKNHNVSNTLKNKIKKFNDSESFEIEREINKYEKLAETVKSNREFNQINNELDLLYKKLKSVKKELFSDNLNNVLEEYKNDRKSKDFSDRLETKILKSLGYDGVDVRGIKAEGGLKSPDDFNHGSVIFDLKPETATTTHEAYYNALGIPEEKRTENQKDLIKSIDDILNKKQEVTTIKVKAEVVKPKVEKQAEPKTLSVENKEYTTKTGRQNVVLKDNDLKVIDIKTGKETSPATRKKALDEYVDRYDFSKGKTAQENAKEAPEGLGIEELNKFTIEQSENPLEIASAYIYEEPISKFAESKDVLIAEFGVGKITQESFKRWKDENLITGGMALTYFNKKEGLPLDVLAKSMSDHYGREIDPQDIANFIVKYPSGSSAALREIESPTGRLAAERFKEVTGLDLYRNMAEKIVNAEFEKKKQIEKDLIKEDYETAQQLEDAYWSAYKETDGFTKESPIGEIKPTEAAEKGVEEAYKDLTINQKRQIINSKFEELLKELKIEKICPT